MATSKEYHDYIVENLRKAGEVTTRKMMGEYCVYYQGARRPGDAGPAARQNGAASGQCPEDAGSAADGTGVKKLIGDICGNCLFLKPTESVLRLLPDAERAYPYEGSKTLMVVVEDVEDTELMAEILDGMYAELPEPKKKKR